MAQLFTAGERLDWYLKAKFGLFIHWGAYSVAGVEASWPIMTPDLSEILFKNTTRIAEPDYVKLPAQFNPKKFDARAWVQLAKETGVRYIVLTAKHHDGFCMFDAPGTDYKITNTPYKKDICLELAEACAESGMRLGFYYSPPDMHHPGYRDTQKPATANWLGEPKRPEWSSYLDYMESHLRKLLTDYGEVSILWFDGLVNHQKYDPPRFHRLIHSLSPATLINDRLGDDYDFITPEQFIPHEGIPIRTGKPPSGNQGGEGLFRSVPLMLKVPILGRWIRSQLTNYADGSLELTKIPQAPNPDPLEFQPWETCMTIGQSWAYNPKEDKWKTPQQLVRNLVEVVSRGGNYLLNTGPAPDGTIPPEAIERLKFIGQWVSCNAEAIYGSTYTAPLNGFTGRVTRKAGCYYLHVLDWPSTGKIVLDAFPAAVNCVSLMTGEPLSFGQIRDRLEIQLPAQPPDKTVSVIAVRTDNPIPKSNHRQFPLGGHMKRYGMVIKVKPEKLEEYLDLHAHPWPGVLKMIEACNIRNYSIYLKDGFLFSYFEYIGSDYAADMAQMAADPTTQEWWKRTDPCQEGLATRKPGEWWAEMDEVFHTD